MAQKENQRITLTKKLLQEGLLRLLEQKSLDKISVTELCRESGINRATFYNHYNSPHDLLTSIEAKLVTGLKEIINSPKTADNLHDHLEALCTYFYDNGRTILILHNCNADRELTKSLYEYNLDFHGFRLKTKYSPNIQPEAIHLISVYFYTGCYNLALEWLQKGIPATPKEIAELLLALGRENFVE